MARRHKKHDHEEHADETWLIPYADLLTLLLALFIVLFAASSVDAKKFQAIMVSFNNVLSGGSNLFLQSNVVPIDTLPGQQKNEKNETQGVVQPTRQAQQTQALSEQAKKFQEETRDLMNLKQKIDAYIKNNGLTSQLSTELNRHQLLLRISDNALFASGRADVKPDAQKLAFTIADLLVQYPNYEVIVSGHTDNRPIDTAEFHSNWDLSSKRALNFMKYLLQNNKLDPARFSAVGYGEYRPVASNDTAMGRAANRRVEVAIVRNITDDSADSVNADGSTPATGTEAVGHAANP